MQTRGLMRLRAVTVLCAALIPGYAYSGGHGLALGPPAGIPMPELPSMARGPNGLPDPSRAARGDVAAEAATRGLIAASEAHRARARELWRANRDVLDFDPERHLIVRNEIVALDPAVEAIAAAQARGFVVRRQEALEGLDAAEIVLEAPRGISPRRALRQLRAADPGGAYDYNHIYFESGTAGSPAGMPQRHAGATRARRVGLIDGGIAVAHPALQSVAVHTHGCSGAPVPSLHGTEVASLLADAGNESASAPRKTELYAADVYCGAPTGGAADALIEALAWLVRERVPVINVSLVGPPNALLGRAIDLAAQRGYLIVAAVGNDGPAAPPLYPAAYPQVVAVTGVDRSKKVLLEAGRGTHVDFAAPAADMFAASLPDGRSQVRGTSFAAPIVAGLLAERLDHPDRALADEAMRELIASAIDLGARGYDPVYGNGFVSRDLPTTSAPVAQAR